MKEGFKENSLSSVSLKWEMYKLENLVSIESGVSPSQYDFTDFGSNMFYKVSQLNDFDKYMKDSPYRFQTSSRKNIPANSIAFPKRGAAIFTNKVRILSYPAMVDTNIMCLIPKDKINHEFLFYFILDFGLSKIADTSSIPQINNKHIYPIKIALPPLPEQQKIAEILSTVDAKIEIIDQQISETSELKKGLMQRLLTKGIGHTKFKDSVLGEIPESWEVVFMEDIADVKGGKRLPKGDSLTEQKTKHPYIRVADMYMGGVSLEKILYVPEKTFPLISRYIISKDDLFISVAGTLGLVGEIPKELDGANLTENADKLTNIKVDKSFLLQVLLSPIIQSAIEREKTNNAQPKLALTRIKTFQIPLPSREEQQKIAEILTSVDDKLQILSEKKVTYQELKQGLMQQLLTGKVRVKV